MAFDPIYLANFLIGLLGGVHCASMCGGIVTALSLQPGQPKAAAMKIHFAYSLGRISTYTLLGAVLGGLASIPALYEGLLPVQLSFYVLAQCMLIALGLYLLGVTHILSFLERGGQKIWQHVQPLTRRFLPVRTTRQALLVGGIWGLIPCGMVYSALTTALLTGSITRGAGMMLAFGLGTLPNLMLAGMAFTQFRGFTQNKWVRWASGCLVMGFGLYGLWTISARASGLWQHVMC